MFNLNPGLGAQAGSYGFAERSRALKFEVIKIFQKFKCFAEVADRGQAILRFSWKSELPYRKVAMQIF